jgi:fluoroquinolone transport system permease protein
MATINVRALTAFGRNDLRSTYRDPLLVMIVLAPVIWTTGVAVLAPRFTEMLAVRYDFDLAPYHPLVLTAFLLLTSIIIVGGLASFLVLDEVDAGTLTAPGDTSAAIDILRLPRRDRHDGRDRLRHRDDVVSGILEPGLAPALVPIGLLAGVSAVVTLLLIVAVAGNRIQGLATDGGLGMLIAGLPCLPWFIHSGWNLAFGVLPTVLGSQGLLGSQRPRHLVAVPARRSCLQHRHRVAAVSSLHGQEHLAGQVGDERLGLPAEKNRPQNDAAIPWLRGDAERRRCKLSVTLVTQCVGDPGAVVVSGPAARGGECVV